MIIKVYEKTIYPFKQAPYSDYQLEKSNLSEDYNGETKLVELPKGFILGENMTGLAIYNEYNSLYTLYYTEKKSFALYPHDYTFHQAMKQDIVFWAKEVSKIYAKRAEKEMTQKELADKIGVSQQELSRWEVGKFKPKTDKLVLIAQALECDLQDLI